MATDTSTVRDRLEAERHRLLSLQDGLREDLGESQSASLEELSDIDQHPAETATGTVTREQELTTMESAAAGLEEVERALDRLEQGTYGTCTACGRPIGAERLEALPATPFCIDDAQLASAASAAGDLLGRPGAGPSGSGLEEPGRPL